MLLVHTEPEKFENAAITGHCDLCFEENWGMEMHDYSHIIFENSIFKESIDSLKLFAVHAERQCQCFQFPPV